LKALDVVGLTVRYGERVVLRDVDLHLEAGEIYGLRGSNGTGKSTLLRAVCGLARRQAGTIAIAEQDLRGQRMEALKRVGYAAQQFGLYEDLTVDENLRFSCRCQGLGGAGLEKAIAGAMDQFDLGRVAAQPAGTLSHGWKQRLSIAAATRHCPALLLLDEATAGLDVEARDGLLQLLRRLAADGMAILLTTHFSEDLVVCGRTGCIRDTRLVQ
jgi:ABC-2 type transport system ATP-binding protein